MAFTLPLPTVADPGNTVDLEFGQILFIVGPNGTGKSRLMQRFFSIHSNTSQRISAHRQNFFNQSSVSLTSTDRINAEQQFQSNDSNVLTAWYDNHAELRIRAALYDLAEAENSRARRIAEAVDAANMDRATQLATTKSPLHSINELLRLSNLPIVISLREDGTILASKFGGPQYGINFLSDGERNALIIISTVLTAKSGTLLLIDEPERHLHHSISAPMLSALLSRRSDCAFVVSTHDIMLPVTAETAVTLLLRGCQINGPNTVNWDVDVLPAGALIDELTKEEILGARRKILFIEGIDASLDFPLYSLVFPEISIVPKSSCRDVEHAVSIIREEQELHWVRAFGIIDRDAREQEEVNQLKSRGIYAIPFYSVEAIYYHPEIQRMIAGRQAALLGGNAGEYLQQASVAALEQVDRQADHLSRRIAEKAAREQVFQRLPNRRTMLMQAPITINIDVAEMVNQERTRLRAWLAQGDFLSLLLRYPLRESGALGAIASSLQFNTRNNYEKAVIKLLMDDATALEFVRSLLDTLPVDIAL